VSIEFNCSSCGTTLRVPDEHLGKQARCPNCQNLNVVQAASADPFASSYPASAPVPPAKSANPYAVGQGNVLPSGGISRRAYQSAHRGGMILTLGILSIVCNIAAVPGILAWVMGRADLKQMDEGRMDPEGRGTTQAGMIMGMIMTIFAIIGIVIMICYFLFIIIVIAGAAGAAGAGGGM
jgi:predicted RNA-binding Zn-ribbon protein involved in translation (DUF1610 family)